MASRTMCVTTLCAGAAQEYNECEYFELRKQTVYWAAMYLGLAWPVVTQLMIAVTATDDVQISKLLWKTVRTKRTNMHSSYLCSFPNSPFLLAFSPLDLLSLDHRVRDNWLSVPSSLRPIKYFSPNRNLAPTCKPSKIDAAEVPRQGFHVGCAFVLCFASQSRQCHGTAALETSPPTLKDG